MGPARKIGTFLHPLAATTSLSTMLYAKVVMSSIVRGLSSGELTGPHVVVPTGITLGLRSEYCVVPKYGMAENIVTASTVLLNSAGTSLPGPSQGRNIDKRRKRFQQPSVSAFTCTLLPEMTGLPMAE
uniref:Uncharacterized protein n=1 Tax=Timema douglasi TaxID=61478 RepID=A0A7R8ZFN5_TIMDO|nr:unnamed protein product [Timema douglasi]